MSFARLLIDAESNVVRTLTPFRGDYMTKGTDVINKCLYRQKNLIGEPSTVMFRRGQSARGFNENYTHIVDLEMWFHLLEQGKFAYLSEPLSAFRVHPDQQTAVNRRDLRRVEDMFHLLEDYVNKPYVDLGKVFKRYLEYRQVHEIWKLYVKKHIGRRPAFDIIDRRWGIAGFFLLLPLYGVFRHLLKARIALGNALDRHPFWDVT